MRTREIWSTLKSFLRVSLPVLLFELRMILRSRINFLSIDRRANGYIIGPTNSANQATAWALALSAGRDTNFAHSLRISADPSKEWFTTNHEVRAIDRKEEVVRKLLLSEVFMPMNIILMESLRPIFAFRKGGQGFAPRHCIDDILLLRRMGKKVGVIFHGSDIRDPLAHALGNPHSPFLATQSVQESDPESQQSHLEAQVLRPEAQLLHSSAAVNRELIPRLRSMGIPIFITTPDLVLEAPDAIWLPVVIDLPRFSRVADESPLFSAKKIRVLYLPSRSWIKSSEKILPILERLDKEGLIEWKNWVDVGAVIHDQIAGILADTDVVIDQFIGLLGVFALEAIAAGRIVLTYIDAAHAHYPTPPHILITPESLENELRLVIAAREKSMVRRQVLESENGEPVLRFIPATILEGLNAGRDFISEYHDGRHSASIIESTMQKGSRKIGDDDE